MDGLIYLDHAATTPVHPLVRQAMMLYHTEYYGNPETLYSAGIAANEAVEDARRKVAALINCDPSEIYFTGGGTEADNWAVKGTAYAREKKGKHIVTSAIEHHAALEPCHFLEKRGFDVTRLPVDSDGMVTPDDVKKAIRKDTILVSIMHANNEVGTVEPVEEIGEITREAGVAFLVDAVQTAGNYPVDVQTMGCDMLALSAHKLYGPKGVGALYLRKGTRLVQLLHGGGQEGGKRAGTHNVHGIVGLGRAAEIAMEEMTLVMEQETELRDRLIKGILDGIPDVRLNGHATRRLPNNVNVCVEKVEGEAMLLSLDMKRICCSSGSACTTGSLEPSHVLLALGVPVEIVHGSLRFSLGRWTTEEQIDYVLEVLPGIVQRLRGMSPVK